MPSKGLASALSHIARLSLRPGQPNFLTSPMSTLRSLTPSLVSCLTKVKCNIQSKQRCPSSGAARLPAEVMDQIAEHIYPPRNAQIDFSASSYQLTRLLPQKSWRRELIKGRLIPWLSDVTKQAFYKMKDEDYDFEAITLGLIKTSVDSEGPLQDCSENKLESLGKLNGLLKWTKIKQEPSLIFGLRNRYRVWSRLSDLVQHLDMEKSQGNEIITS